MDVILRQRSLKNFHIFVSLPLSNQLHHILAREASELKLGADLKIKT